MIPASSANWKLPVGDFHSNSAKLQQSIKRLSSGDAFIVPGGDSAGLAISERMRAQLSNTEQALKNIKHAQSALQTIDSWLQQANDIVARMSSLATSSVDGSKSAEDRTNLNVEFQELKEEIKRISSEVEYNGLKVMGNTGVFTYDLLNESITYMQSDGSQIGSFSVAGDAVNGETFNYATLEDAIMAADSRSYLYIDTTFNLRRYDLVDGTLTATTANTQLATGDRLVMSDQGEIYVSADNGDGTAAISKVNLSDMSLEASVITANAEPSSDFAIVGDYAIYQEITTFDIVKQNLYNVDDKTTLYDTPAAALAGGHALSKDGRYLAEVNVGNAIVTNLETGLQSEIFMGATDIRRLGFDSNNNLYGRNPDSFFIVKVALAESDTPLVADYEIIYTTDTENHMKNLFVGGGSPIQRATFQVGADEGMTIDTGFADIEMSDLGIAHLNISTMDDAEDAIAALSTATNRISTARANIGAQVSRLSFTSAGSRSYANNISQAESMIRDADVAKETAELAAQKLRTQMALGMISETNEMTLALLSLLR